MNEPVPYAGTQPGPVASMADRRMFRAVAAIQRRTVVRVAAVQAEGLVQTEKAHEIDALTREALTGQVMLHKWAESLAGADPLLADELRFFTDMARLGKGEVIADTISTFCRER